MKKHNFSAGPSILFPEVIAQSAAAVLDFNQSGLSLLEISHRSKDFVAVMEEAQDLTLELLGLDKNDYYALFLQGGASLQFLITVVNLMKEGGKSSYLDTGAWSTAAVKESKNYGETIVVASSKDKNYSYIPKEYTIPSDADYFHCTSNNTIFGTQMKSFPKTDIPMVCDMSSDIFSRDLDFSQFSLIYAGAQKNLGPAGTTLVVVKKDVLGKTGRTIPNMLNLQVHIDKESMYNTPAVFPVYCSLLSLRYIKKLGGIAAVEKNNIEKAKILYDEIERNPLFIATANKEDQSNMNVCFLLKDESHQETFDKMWKAANISGINGHRSVGGYRASIYNAMPKESIEVLINVMQELEKNI